MADEKEKPKEKEKPDYFFAGLKKDIQKGAEREAGKALGKEVKFNELKEKPEELNDVVQQLYETWNGFWDKLFGILGAFGIKEDDVEASFRAPPENDEEPDEIEPEPKDWKERHRDISWRDQKHVEHANRALAENREWMNYIEQSSAKYDIPKSTLIAFIELESGFNPHNRPMNRKTGKLRSSALGLSQALNSTWEKYQQRTGKPGANRENPSDAIDFMGWYCFELINSVDRLIKRDRDDGREGFKSEYAITKTDAENMYLAYNNGPYGYLVLRRYMDNPTQKNFNELRYFQKKDAGKSRIIYAERVSSVAETLSLVYS